MPIGMPRCRRRAAGGRSLVRQHGRQQPDRRAPAAPVQAFATALRPARRRPSARSSAASAGRRCAAAPARKCSFSGGEAAAGRAAPARWRRAPVDHRVVGSPSRSSSWVPNRSRTAGRSSIHRRAGDDHVDAVAQAAGGESVIDGLQVLELLAQRQPAVDDQEHVAERVVGELAARAGAAGRWPCRRCRARRTAAPAGAAACVTSATVRRTASTSSRAATPPTCGRSAQRRERAAAEVEAVELHLARGVGERQAARSACAAACSCRSAARRPRPRGRPRRPGRARSRSRRCSNGRSTMPTDGRAARRAAPASPTVRPRPVSAASGGSSWSSVGGSSSGGSHTWCAGAPWPSSRSTRMSSSALADAVVVRSRRRLAASARSTGGAT